MVGLESCRSGSEWVAMLEALLVKIAGAVFKKALAGVAGKVAAAATSAIQVYSTVETVLDTYHCVRTCNDCHDLGVCGVRVLSDPLSDEAIERVVGLGRHSFVVRRASSGIYIASRLGPQYRAYGLRFPELLTQQERRQRFPSFSRPNFPKFPKS